MLILVFVLAALMTWRIASLLARERGAFAVFTVVRTVFGVAHDPDGTPSYDDEGDVVLMAVTPWERVDLLLHEVGMALVCVWCNSVWVAGGVALLVVRVVPFLYVDPAFFWITVFALSAAAIVLDRVLMAVDRLGERETV